MLHVPPSLQPVISTTDALDMAACYVISEAMQRWVVTRTGNKNNQLKQLEDTKQLVIQGIRNVLPCGQVSLHIH